MSHLDEYTTCPVGQDVNLAGFRIMSHAPLNRRKASSLKNGDIPTFHVLGLWDIKNVNRLMLLMGHGQVGQHEKNASFRIVSHAKRHDPTACHTRDDTNSATHGLKLNVFLTMLIYFE